MKEKVVISVCSLLVLIALGVGIYYLFFKKVDNKVISEDAIKFKEEYESLNDKTIESNGKVYRTVNISEDNPFVYKTAEEIAEMIENDESFIVYFGFKTCPWCRSVISTLDQVAHDKNIKKIYYVDVLDIRDTLTVNSKNKVETTKEGTEGYYKLLKLMDNVLEKYTLTNSKGKEIDTDEKRIYAPNVAVIIKGNAEKLVSGNSEKQTDAYMELTDEMVKETYNMFSEIIQIYLDNDCENQKVC